MSTFLWFSAFVFGLGFVARFIGLVTGQFPRTSTESVRAATIELVLNMVFIAWVVYLLRATP